MHWSTVWAWLQTWQGAIPATIAVLAAVYYGPRKMLETWDWYWDRFRDNAVLFLIERRKIITGSSLGGGLIRTNIGPPPKPIELPYTAPEIASYLQRKESSVRRSLRRLERHGKIEPMTGGWRLKV